MSFSDNFHLLVITGLHICGFVLKWPIFNCAEGFLCVFSVTLETVMFCLVYFYTSVYS